MRKLDTLTADQLLAAKNPEQLFSRSKDTAKAEYHGLTLQWHPDHNRHPKATDVLSLISRLYREALDKITNDTWKEPVVKIEDEREGVKKFRDSNGKIKSMKFRYSRVFELGTMYVGNSVVTYELESQHEDLWRRARRQIQSFKFHDDRMKQEMFKFLPRLVDSFRTQDSCVLVLEKTPDQILLRDVLDHFAGKLDSGHAGWILNVLYNITCYLQYAGITHNGISADTFFISPGNHTGMLVGGWWYAVEEGSKMLALPEETFRWIPPDVLRGKEADFRTDLELVRAIGRTLLGDAGGSSLQHDGSLPKSLVHWLTLPSSGDAVEEYRTYKHKILPDSFGPPRFIKLDVTAEEIYAKGR